MACMVCYGMFIHTLLGIVVVDIAMKWWKQFHQESDIYAPQIKAYNSIIQAQAYNFKITTEIWIM